MTTSDLIAITALIISVLSLWMQTKGTSKQVMVSNYESYTNRYAKIIEKLPESVVEEDFDINKLSEKEKIYILRYMVIYFDLCFEEYTLYHELHFIDKRMWNFWENSMIGCFRRPAFSQCWRIISVKTSYKSSFKKFVESILSSNR